ncbi:hypothetical protein [Frankia sp. CcWB2]
MKRLRRNAGLLLATAFAVSTANAGVLGGVSGQQQEHVSGPGLSPVLRELTAQDKGT